MEQQVLQTGTTAAILCPPGVSGEGRCSVGLRITPLLAGAVAAQLRGRERVAVCYDGTPAGERRQSFLCPLFLWREAIACGWKAPRRAPFIMAGAGENVLWGSFFARRKE